MPKLYLDSCVFILAVENTGNLVEPARRLMHGLSGRPGVSVTSELTIAELLAPTKRTDAMSLAERSSLYLSLFDDGDFIQLVPISRPILLRTVELRERLPQRLPDAIHVATAVNAGCRYFASYDRHARRLPEALEWIIPDQESVDRLLTVLDA